MEEARKCVVCEIDISDKRQGAKTCSKNCRKELSRLESVTHNVTLSVSDVTLIFEFYTISKANGLGRKEDEKSTVRKAKYWYDVPLAAIPVIQKGWPKMPDFMNGRQYFLWWKNEFEVRDAVPVIHNPFPQYDNVRYEMGGEGSRRWGA